MEQILKALQLAKDSTYAGEMIEPAKEHLRKQLDEAMQQVKNLSLNQSIIGSGMTLCKSCFPDAETEIEYGNLIHKIKRSHA